MPRLTWEAADASPGQVPSQAPQAGVAGLLSAQPPGSKAREHWHLSTAGISLLGCGAFCSADLCPPAVSVRLGVSSPVFFQGSEGVLTWD